MALPDRAQQEYLSFRRATDTGQPGFHQVPWNPASRIPTSEVPPGSGPPLKVGSIEYIPLINCRLKVFTPDCEPPPDGWPVLVWLHGGGWVFGKGIDGGPSGEVLCTNLCQRSSVIVASVDYRLAPEDPFPAAVEDAWEALSWIHSNGRAALNINLAQICVGGASAGANLAAVLTHLAARGESPIPLKFQLLIVPAVDNVATLETSQYQSWTEHKDIFGLNSEQIHWFRRQYVPNEVDRADWKVSPILAPAESFSKVPPAWIAVAELDILRDEGIAYGAKLNENGSVAEVVRYATVHAGFTLDACVRRPFINAEARLIIYSLLPEGRRVTTDACLALRQAVQSRAQA